MFRVRPTSPGVPLIIVLLMCAMIATLLTCSQQPLSILFTGRIRGCGGGKGAQAPSDRSVEAVLHRERSSRVFIASVVVPSVPTFLLMLHDPKTDVWISKGILETGSWESPIVEKILVQFRLLRETADESFLFVDCGANIGSHALSMAAAGVETIAVEPLLANFRLLQDSRDINRFQDRLTVHRFALGTSNNGTVCLSVPADNAGGTHQQSVERCPLALTAELRRLDSLIPANRKIGVLKIDVEGMEYAVLAGSTGIFRSPHPPPFVYIEYAPCFMQARASTPQLPNQTPVPLAILQHMCNLGYSIRDERAALDVSCRPPNLQAFVDRFKTTCSSTDDKQFMTDMLFSRGES